MSRPLVVANWKMNLTVAESVRLAAAFRRERWRNIDLVIAPTAAALSAVNRALGRSRAISLGAQEVAVADRGAYTGETSPLVLREVGCRYVIIGHSERKVYFHETLTTIGERLRAALAHDLTPIVCVGETEVEHRAGQSDHVIAKQVTTLTESLPPSLRHKPLIICDEPFWTISTSGGKIPSSAEIQHRSRVIWQALIDAFGHAAAVDHVRVIYGGTVNAHTVGSVKSIPEISGFLVGSAATQLVTFRQLITALASE